MSIFKTLISDFGWYLIHKFDLVEPSLYKSRHHGRFYRAKSVRVKGVYCGPVQLCLREARLYWPKMDMLHG